MNWVMVVARHGPLQQHLKVAIAQSWCPISKKGKYLASNLIHANIYIYTYTYIHIFVDVYIYNLSIYIYIYILTFLRAASCRLPYVGPAHPNSIRSHWSLRICSTAGPAFCVECPGHSVRAITESAWFLWVSWNLWTGNLCLQFLHPWYVLHAASKM